MDKVDAVVVGAGVVGLAAARALAQGGLDVLVLEAEGCIGSGVSSRNSEVMHAGLYYPPGSLKARLCVAGRARLAAYCEARAIKHRRCGKLIVANDAQDEHGAQGSARLDRMLLHAQACGVHDLQRLGAAQAREMEPALACSGALWSPSSGIVDSHALMLSLLADAEAAGALLALRSPFLQAWREGGRWIVSVGVGADETFVINSRWIINAAGLSAQGVARAMRSFPAAAVPRQFLAKGHYFALATKAPFSRLIYPMPVDGGLGVHLTLDLAGGARFGPDVQWLADGAEPALIDYGVDESRLPAFEAAIRHYWPALPQGALQPAYSGVRPKLSGPGAPAADFQLLGPAEHGCDGVLQLFGIESPGLTAALALADVVAQIVCSTGQAGSKKAGS